MRGGWAARGVGLAPAHDTPSGDEVGMPEPRHDALAAAMPAYVYAIGRIEPRFPRLSAEKEFAQATGRAETAGLTDRQALHAAQLTFVHPATGTLLKFNSPLPPDLSGIVEAFKEL